MGLCYQAEGGAPASFFQYFKILLRRTLKVNGHLESSEYFLTFFGAVFLSSLVNILSDDLFDLSEIELRQQTESTTAVVCRRQQAEVHCSFLQQTFMESERELMTWKKFKHMPKTEYTV